METRLRTNQLRAYDPYPKQASFHAAGATHRERLFLAGNRLGKTEAGCAELAMHLTGQYPEWWPGRRFEGSIRAWAASETNALTRDGVQTKLLGMAAQKEAWGTGSIPKRALGRITMQTGVRDAIDTVLVKHVDGEWSTLSFKSYEHGRTKFQAVDLDVCYFDEEPPADIYSEGFTRTHDRQGLAYITATPLKGMSEVVRAFLLGKDATRDLADDSALSEL